MRVPSAVRRGGKEMLALCGLSGSACAVCRQAET